MMTNSRLSVRTLALVAVITAPLAVAVSAFPGDWLAKLWIPTAVEGIFESPSQNGQISEGQAVAAPTAVLLSWNTFGNAGLETTEPSAANDPNIVAASLTLGAGVTPSSGVNRFGGNQWFDSGDTTTGTTLAESIAGNDYIQFIVSPNAGYAVTPTSLDFKWDASATGAVNVAVRSSADNFTSNIATFNGIINGALNSATISNISNATTPITFRIYGFGATGSLGTGGFRTSTSEANVILNGTVTLLAPSISVTPSSVSFPNQVINTTGGSQTITVTNNGTANLVLNSVTLTTGTQFSFLSNPNGTVVPPGGGSTTIAVRFMPTSVGAKTDTVTINSNASGPPPTVSLSGTGIAFVADLEQCRNGTVASPAACTGTNWFAGNVSSSLSHWFEGQSVPYRQKLLAFTPGATVHTVTIGYDTTKSGKHAFDYLTSYDRTETTAMGNDPCSGFSGCSLGTVSTFPIPADPNVSAGFDQIPGNADDITQVPGVFTMYGGTITGVSSYTLSGSYAGDSHKAITISFTAQSTNLWLAWGGHIASRQDWGTSGTTVDVAGSPYHMTQDSCSFTCGSQDRTIGSTAVGTLPTGQGSATPSTVLQGGSTVLTVTAAPGTDPASTTLAVTANLSAIGGSATQTFLDNGVAPDATAGDNIFTYGATVAMATTPGAVSLPFTVSDAQSRSSSGNIALTVVGTGTFTLSSAAYQALENVGSVPITINRTNGSFGSVQVTLNASGGTATGGTSPCVPGQDYVSGDTVVNFASGETSKIVNISVCDDAVLEDHETFTASISAVGATVSPIQSATVTIRDNEPRTRLVDRLDDSSSADECTANPNDCSLRRAIETANDGDLITFDPAVFNLTSLAPQAQTIVLGGEIAIASDIAILGPGASLLTVDAGPGTNRIYNIAAGTTVSISGLSLTGGSLPASSGGAIFADSGSSLSLDGVNVSGNTASFGGAIVARNVLNITNSVITDNSATGGGAIWLVESGSLTLANSTVSDNTGGQIAGAIWATFEDGPQIKVNISGSTFSNNCAGSRATASDPCPATGNGGAIFFEGPGVPDSFSITNSTFSNNLGSSGGGLYYTNASVGAVVGSTFSNSTVNSDGGGTASQLTLRNSIMSGCTLSGVGGIVDGGFNLDVANTCGFTQPTSKTNTDPLLGPLQYNGGPTFTMALLTGSPAIDAGSAFGLTTDQRGLPRPVDRPGIPNAGDASDIGAYELMAPTAATASISGRVVDANGRGISSAVISVQDFTGTTRRFYTNTFGYFDASGLRAGESYLVSVSSRRHTFAVSTRLIDLGDSISGIDFVATR